MAMQASPSEWSPSVLEEASTVELVREVMDEARELARIEIALAKEDVKDELRHAQRAVVALGIALAASVVVLSLLAVALVLAIGGTAVAALLVALGFLIVGAIAGGLGVGLLPKAPLAKTRERLENDVNQLKEHVA